MSKLKTHTKVYENTMQKLDLGLLKFSNYIPLYWII